MNITFKVESVAIRIFLKFKTRTINKWLFELRVLVGVLGKVGEVAFTSYQVFLG
jgi:hypothetical protein